MATSSDGSLICSRDLDAPVLRTEDEVQAQRIRVIRAGFLSGAIDDGEAVLKLVKTCGLDLESADLLRGAWYDLLADARRIEIRRIECANDFLYSQQGPDYHRLLALQSERARPSAWAIDAALEDAKDAEGLRW